MYRRDFGNIGGQVGLLEDLGGVGEDDGDGRELLPDHDDDNDGGGDAELGPPPPVHQPPAPLPRLQPHLTRRQKGGEEGSQTEMEAWMSAWRLWMREMASRWFPVKARAAS